MPHTIDVQKFDRVIGLKWIASGQPRPYADSVYHAELTFTGKSGPLESVLGCHPPESCVKEIARVLVHPFCDAPKHGLESTLRKLECVENVPGLSRWVVVILSPYTD